jgi:hypothetical protein
MSTEWLICAYSKSSTLLKSFYPQNNHIRNHYVWMRHWWETAFTNVTSRYMLNSLSQSDNEIRGSSLNCHIGMVQLYMKIMVYLGSVYSIYILSSRLENFTLGWGRELNIPLLLCSTFTWRELPFLNCTNWALSQYNDDITIMKLLQPNPSKLHPCCEELPQQPGTNKLKV